MAFSWKSILVIFLMALLLSGCAAINKLMNEEVTGPSWDMDFALPLLPRYKVEVGKILADDEEDIKPFDPIRFGEAFEFQGIDLDEQIELSAFAFQEEERVDVGEDFGDDMEQIRDSFDREEVYDIDEKAGDKTSLEKFDFIEEFDSTDDGFGDIEDKRQDMEDAFDKLEPEEIKMPDVDEDYGKRVIDEIDDKFQSGPDSHFITTDADDFLLALPEIEFTQFRYVYFSSGKLMITLENKTSEEIKKMTVGLYDPEGQSFLVIDDADGPIIAGGTGRVDLDLDGVKIVQKVQIVITLTLDESINNEEVVVTTDTLDDFNIDKVRVVEGSGDEFPIDETEPIEELSETIKEVTFKSGNLHIEFDLPGELNIGQDDYELEIIGLADRVLREGDNDLEDVTVYFNKGPGADVGEVTFKVEDADTYVVGAKATVTFTFHDTEMKRVVMIELEDIDPPTETIIPDDEDVNVKEVIFESGDLIIDLTFYPEAWKDEIDYDLEIEIGEEKFFEGKNPLDESMPLNLEEIKVTFKGKTDTYYEGGLITVRIYFDEDTVIKEATLKDPIELDELVEKEIDFSEDLKEVTINEGWLLVDIDDDDLNIDYTLGIFLDGQELLEVDGIPGAYSLAGIVIADDGEGLRVEFKADVELYKKEKEVKVKVSLHEDEELVIGRVILKEPKKEGIEQSLEELLGDDIDFLKYIKFSQGFLEVTIDEGDLEMDYSISCAIGGVTLEPVEEGEGYFLYSLKGLEIDLEVDSTNGEDLGFKFEFSITEFTYDPNAIIIANAEMRDMEWEEIRLLFDKEKLGFETEFTIFDVGEEEIVEMGLDELPDLIKHFSLNPNPELSFFYLTVENITPVEFKVIEPLKIIPQDADGEPYLDEDGVPIEVLIVDGDFTVDLNNPVNLIEKFVDIFDTFPHQMVLSGGKMELVAPVEEGEEPIVTFRPGMRFEMGTEFDFALSFILQKDPLDLDPSIEIQMAPNPIDMEEMEMLTWLQEASLNYEIINHMPLDGVLKFYMGEFLGDPEDEDDVKAFYKQEDIFMLEIIGLPEAKKDKDGFAIGESAPYARKVIFSEEATQWFKRDHLHTGIVLEIPFDDDKYITFSTSDYLSIKAWAYFKIRVNPKD